VSWQTPVSASVVGLTCYFLKVLVPQILESQWRIQGVGFRGSPEPPKIPQNVSRIADLGCNFRKKTQNFLGLRPLDPPLSASAHLWDYYFVYPSWSTLSWPMKYGLCRGDKARHGPMTKPDFIDQDSSLAVAGIASLILWFVSPSLSFHCRDAAVEVC